MCFLVGQYGLGGGLEVYRHLAGRLAGKALGVGQAIGIGEIGLISSMGVPSTRSIPPSSNQECTALLGDPLSSTTESPKPLGRKGLRWQTRQPVRSHPVWEGVPWGATLLGTLMELEYEPEVTELLYAA